MKIIIFIVVIRKNDYLIILINNTMSQQLSILAPDFLKLFIDNEQLRQENAKLKQENLETRTILKIREEEFKLKHSDIEKLVAKNEELLLNINEIVEENKKLRQENQLLHDENKFLQLKITEKDQIIIKLVEDMKILKQDKSDRDYLNKLGDSLRYFRDYFLIDKLEEFDISPELDIKQAFNGLNRKRLDKNSQIIKQVLEKLNFDTEIVKKLIYINSVRNQDTHSIDLEEYYDLDIVKKLILDLKHDTTELNTDSSIYKYKSMISTFSDKLLTYL
jgi:hypothetical protein